MPRGRKPVSPEQISYIKEAYTRDDPISDIVSATGLAESTVHKVTAQLAKDGLIKRRMQFDDRQRSRMSESQKRRHNLARDLERELANTFTAEEMAEAREATLDRIAITQARNAVERQRIIGAAQLAADIIERFGLTVRFKKG